MSWQEEEKERRKKEQADHQRWFEQCRQREDKIRSKVKPFWELLKSENAAIDSELRLIFSSQGEHETLSSLNGNVLSYPNYRGCVDKGGQYQEEIGASNTGIIRYNESYNQLILIYYPYYYTERSKIEYLIDNQSATITIIHHLNDHYPFVSCGYA